jgi:hypothetical protein
MLKTVTFIFCIVLTSHAQTTSPLTVYLEKAEQGDAGAQFWLGAAYESGRGIKQDFAQAIKWLRKSATQGNADADWLLGQIYENGKGLPRDYAKASEWYRLACEHRPDRGGAGQGCNSLGLLYLDGDGVKRDIIAAYKYFKIAANAGNLDVAKHGMTAEEIDGAERQAEQWIEAHPDP